MPLDQNNENVVPIGGNDIELPVDDGAAIPAGTRALLIAGSDGANARILSTDGTGALNITGSISATNPSVSTNNAAIPTSSTQIGGSDGTNLQALRVFDLDTGGGSEYDLGVNLRRSASGGSEELLGQTTMAKSIPVAIASDQSALTITPAADSTATGTLSLLNDTVSLALVGKQSCGYQFAAGTLIAQVATEVSTDGGSTWNQAFSQNSNGTLNTSDIVVVGSALSGAFLLPGGATHARLRVSNVFVAGSVSATITATDVFPDSFTQYVATGAITVAQGTNPWVTSVISTPYAAINGTSIPAESALIGGSDGTNIQPARIFDLDTGGGTEYSLGVNLRRSAAGGSEQLLGNTTMAKSLPVTMASDQTAIPVSSTQLPAALVGARLDTNVGAWLGSTAPTVGSKTMANSIPVVVASDQSPVPISGTVTVTGTVTATISAIGNTNAAVPATAIQVGGSDGTNLQTPRVFDADTGGGTEYVLGAILRRSASGGSVEAGTTTNPLAVAGTAGSGFAVSGNPVLSGGSDGVNARTLLTDSSGRQAVVGAAAANAILAGNPVLIGASDGALAQIPLVYDTDTGVGSQFTLGVVLRQSGSGGSAELGTTSTPMAVQGTRADGSAVAGNPVLVGGQDGTNAQSLKTDTTGRVEVIGGAAANAALAGNPVPIAASDGTNAQIPRAFDADTGAGTEYVIGVSLRKSASGGSVELGTTTNPITVAGAAADGAAVSGNPVLMAGQDGTNAQSLLTDTSGRLDQALVGTLANGTQTTVDNTGGGVSILASNSSRKKFIIQNVGSANMRVGVTGVSATTGVRLVPGAIWEEVEPYCPTAAIFAIREGATNTTALAMEIT